MEQGRASPCQSFVDAALQWVVTGGAFSDFFAHNFHISGMLYFDANIWTDGCDIWDDLVFVQSQSSL